MSIKVSINTLSEEQKIKADSITAIKLNDYKYIEPYKIFNDNVYFPFGFAIQELKLSRPTRNKLSIFNVDFIGKLREEQEQVKKEAIKYLNKDGCVLLSLAVGKGKTITSIYLSCRIKLKTLIVVNKLVLIKQWKKSIERFTNAKVQILGSKNNFDETADFYIMNAINIPKKGHDFFKNIQTLIVDELHCIMAEQISYLMNYIQPRYLIGLSATPYRKDNLNILIELYFGKNIIIRELHKPHKVYTVYTDFKPEIKTMCNGRVDFNSILKSISENEDRNNIIVDIVKKFKKRNILILVKRLSQGNYLLDKLLDENIYVDSLLGKKQDFDRDCRVLIGTIGKVGTGFDFDKLDTLILAAPIKDYFIQIFGRITRREDVEPMVFDLIDCNNILINHYKERKETYLKLGGRIYKYNFYT